MAEEVINNNTEKPPKPEKVSAKKKGGLFKKIHANVLLSPGGLILIIFAAMMEILDLIPLPLLDQIWELPLELIFIALLCFIAKVPLKASLAPFILERIPLLSDILPTWVLRMFF